MRLPAPCASRRPSAILAGALVAAVLLARGTTAQLRNLVAVTNSAYDHRDALLSPDGSYVAFRGPNMLAVVAYAGGGEIPVEQANLNIGSFLWSPDSLGLYYLSGVDLRYVPRTGGTSRLVATLPETGINLWAITADGATLFGTWLYVRNNGSQVVRETHVFSIASDGSAPPAVLVQSIVTVDGVELSPDETRMVYREYDPTPFSRRDYIVANADGTNPVSLTGAVGLNLNAGLPHWRPDGTGIVYERLDRAVSRLVIEQLLLGNPTPMPLSLPEPARNLSVSADGTWVVYEGLFPNGNWSPYVVPTVGGAHIALDPSRPFVFAGTPHLGGSNGDRVVVSGTLGSATNAQVYRVELARELVVSPRAELGASVRLAMPLAANELGVILLAAALGAALPVPGLGGAFELDPATSVVVVAGSSSGQATIGIDLPIPNVAALRRAPLALQGARLQSVTQVVGDFTRPARLPFF